MSIAGKAGGLALRNLWLFFESLCAASPGVCASRTVLHLDKALPSGHRFRVESANCRPLAANCVLRTAYCLLPTAYF